MYSMKKAIIIVATVLAMIAATVYADRATRLTTANRNVPDVGGDIKVEGKPAPDLRLKGIDGKDVSLAALKGKVVFLNFWATWCDPCRVEIPWLIDMQTKYGPKGFTIVGIAMDEEGKSAVAPFL